MAFARFVKHMSCTRRSVQRRFPPSTLAAIESAIHDAETRHMGEIRFAVEAALSPQQVMRDMSPHERALEVFSQLRVWDTAHNNGVLIYVLCADHAVEILADRGIHTEVGSDEVWQRIVEQMRQDFTGGRFESGAVKGIAAVAEELARHFPVTASNLDELPNTVTLL